MDNVRQLSDQFSSLPPNEKALFLARVAHAATIDARASYVSTPDHPERDFENPNAIILRDANNFVHRVTGYIITVLDSSEHEGQDESVIAMIVDRFGPIRTKLHLSDWLGLSK